MYGGIRLPAYGHIGACISNLSGKNLHIKLDTYCYKRCDKLVELDDKSTPIITLLEVIIEIHPAAINTACLVFTHVISY